MIVENLPIPFDRRVWQEACTLVEYGYDVSVVCPKGKNFNRQFEILEGVNIYRYYLPIQAQRGWQYPLEYSFAIVAWIYLAVRIYWKKPFQVIHAANPPDLIFIVAYIFKVFTGTKFIFDHHDLNPELYFEKFGRKDLFYRLLHFLERLSMNLADVVVSTNESYKEIAISRGKKDASQVIVVRSGVDLRKFRISNPRLDHKRGKKILVGYIGIIAKQDGVDLLIQAAEYIVKKMQRSDIAFTIIGDGPELENIIYLSKKLGMTEHVTFTGALFGDILMDILNACDICVACDRYCEMNDKSTMNKTMEYMALAKPVVQFDLKEGRYTAKDSSLYAKPDDYVDLAEKIIILADDAELRNKLGALGRKRMEDELQWDKVKSNLINAYNLIKI